MERVRQVKGKSVNPFSSPLQNSLPQRRTFRHTPDEEEKSSEKQSNLESQSLSSMTGKLGFHFSQIPISYQRPVKENKVQSILKASQFAHDKHSVAVSAKPIVHQNLTTPQIQRWVAPTDWLDYLGLGIDVIERIYIELAYKEGSEKEFKRFVNTFFFVIDGILAALPGVGGGGIAIRGSRQLAVAVWGTIPESVKIKMAGEVAVKMGWSVAKAWQIIILFMSISSNTGKWGGTPGNNQVQNRQFNGAVREIEKRIGRKLSKDEIRQLHDTISGQNYGFHEIVEEGVGMFGK